MNPGGAGASPAPTESIDLPKIDVGTNLVFARLMIFCICEAGEHKIPPYVSKLNDRFEDNLKTCGGIWGKILSGRRNRCRAGERRKE